MIFIREGAIIDQAAMDAYLAGNSAAPPVAGLKPLAIYGELETLEGEPADAVVLLEFPDRAAANAWYHSESYQELINLRLKAAPYRCMMVEGL
jgi:uncharacterized protein (DUF1330 family)